MHRSVSREREFPFFFALPAFLVEQEDELLHDWKGDLNKRITMLLENEKSWSSWPSSFVFSWSRAVSLSIPVSMCAVTIFSMTITRCGSTLLLLLLWLWLLLLIFSLFDATMWSLLWSTSRNSTRRRSSLHWNFICEKRRERERRKRENRSTKGKRERKKWETRTNSCVKSNHRKQ